MEREFVPASRLRGILRPPPDKSISHRAALIGAMGGDAVIENCLNAADTRATLAAVRALGGQVDVRPAGETEGHPLGMVVTIDGPGLRGPTAAEIDVGNAGTLLRLLPGWLAGQEGGSWTIDGDASIRSRPVDRIAEPLRQMGADVECRDDRLPPVRVTAAPLTGIEYSLPVASAQVKSCLLLAGLLAEGETSLVEPSTTRDHTERMLRSAGAEVVSDGGRVSVQPAHTLAAEKIGVPGDLSSAAFPIVAALLVPGSEIEIQAVGLNPTRTGLLTILERMGAALEVAETEAVGGEPQGTIRARSSDLAATTVGGEEVALAIDELPLVALAACFAEGETVISGAGELRHKESDRIAGVCEGLAALGGDVEPTDDGMVIRGSQGLRGGGLDAQGDHRMAMLGAVAGLASSEGVSVRGFEAVEVSYPGFEQDLGTLSA